MKQAAFAELYGGPREMAPASLDNWARILPRLKGDELMVLEALCTAIAAQEHADFTGAELADWSGLPILTVRPRLTGLRKKGYVEAKARRQSRIKTEAPSHPYAPVVPLAAVRRARRDGAMT